VLVLLADLNPENLLTTSHVPSVRFLLDKSGPSENTTVPNRENGQGYTYRAVNFAGHRNSNTQGNCRVGESNEVFTTGSACMCVN